MSRPKQYLVRPMSREESEHFVILPRSETLGWISDVLEETAIPCSLSAESSQAQVLRFRECLGKEEQVCGEFAFHGDGKCRMKPTSSIGHIPLASADGLLENSYMVASLAERVQARLDALKLGPIQAAEKGGLERTYIRDIIKPNGKKTVTARLMPKLAAVLQTTTAYLNAETDDPTRPEDQSPATEIRASDRGLITVPKVGRVEAGEFREVLEFDDSEREFLLEQIDPEFPRARMIAYDVLGDSMNASDPPIPPGSVIMCVDFEDTQLPITDGMIVVVERTRNGRLTREWSVKEVVVLNDRTEFHPRSTNLKHEPIIVFDSSDPNDGVEVQVLALVRRISTPVPRFKTKRR